MKSLLSLLTIVCLCGAVARAAELPPSELISPPNALEQFSAAGSVDVKEGRPCSAGEVLRRHLLAKSQLACIAAESNPICCGSPGLENRPGRDGRK